jgi:HSP20 family protein
MRLPIKKSPAASIESIHDDIDRLLSQPFRALEREAPLPSLDMWEDGNNIYIETDIPGMEIKDININVRNDSVTISARRDASKERSEKDYYYSERFLGSFYREIDLPSTVDSSKSSADYKNGVLKITLPVIADESSKSIKINVK